MEKPIKWLLIHAAFRKPEVLISLHSVNQPATCPRNLQWGFCYLHWFKKQHPPPHPAYWKISPPPKFSSQSGKKFSTGLGSCFHRPMENKIPYLVAPPSPELSLTFSWSSYSASRASGPDRPASRVWTPPWLEMPQWQASPRHRPRRGASLKRLLLSSGNSENREDYFICPVLAWPSPSYLCRTSDGKARPCGPDLSPQHDERQLRSLEWSCTALQAQPSPQTAAIQQKHNWH